MTTLQVIVDEILNPSSPEVARYSEELTRALIPLAPRGCVVDGFVSASTDPQYNQLLADLPGLGTLNKSALARRELTAAWQHGFTRLPGRGMVHAPSLFAPLARHDRLNEGDQIVVTVHDTLAWTTPQEVPSRTASWQRAMAKRAERYADAVVVPTHAVAQSVSELLNFGDRVRVISPAASTSLAIPDDEDAVADSLGLPGHYVLVRGAAHPGSRIAEVVDALRAIDDGTELVLVEEGVVPDSITELGQQPGIHLYRDLGSASLAVAIDRAQVVVDIERSAENLIGLLDALSLGTPVVHWDSANLREIAADSTIIVENDGDGDALTEALRNVLSDTELAERLCLLGADRSRAFGWRGSAEKVWQLHADL
ncbi:glycosyltransferase family 1 protein [soil metagenome]